MTYEEIAEMWNKDSFIDRTKLDLAAVSIPSLHNKYFKCFSKERIQLRRLEDELADLRLLKNEYYQGDLDVDIIKEKGWVQWEKLILKGDLGLYMAADKDMQALKMKIAIAFEKVDFLENILKQLGSMNWSIKVAVDFMRFQAGA